MILAEFGVKTLNIVGCLVLKHQTFRDITELVPGIIPQSTSDSFTDGFN